jgi:hypothetical protein
MRAQSLPRRSRIRSGPGRPCNGRDDQLIAVTRGVERSAQGAVAEAAATAWSGARAGALWRYRGRLGQPFSVGPTPADGPVAALRRCAWRGAGFGCPRPGLGNRAPLVSIRRVHRSPRRLRVGQLAGVVLLPNWALARSHGDLHPFAITRTFYRSSFWTLRGGRRCSLARRGLVRFRLSGAGQRARPCAPWCSFAAAGARPCCRHRPDGRAPR